MELHQVRIGGLYSCYHPLEMWIRHGGGLCQRVEDNDPDKPFVILEVDDQLLEHCEIYQIKILTCDGLLRWIDVSKKNTSIKEI